MSYYTIVGSKMFIGTTLATAKTLTGLSNADPTVATVTSHGFSDNDEILHFSGWEDFNGSIYRIDSLTTDTYSLPGYESTDTDFFPSGSGGGTVQKVTVWTEITQVLNVTRQGGSARRISANPINLRNGVQKTVGREPSTLTMNLAWDPSLSVQGSLRTASRRFGKLPFKFLLNGGGYAYAYGEVDMGTMPSFDTNSFMNVDVDVSLDGIFTYF